MKLKSQQKMREKREKMRENLFEVERNFFDRFDEFLK